LFKRELDERAVRSSDVIVVESLEQTKIEAGEFLPLIEKGTLRWSRIAELGDVVAGKAKGRTKDDDITLFKSLGIAVEDIAVAAHVYKVAKGAGMGTKLGMPSN
ncbi:MAG: ornithine cyclodeaminase family protein, partial [Thermodesulfobacteriota bacterium]